MSVWTTKSFEKDREYIILKHTLPNVNNVINGVKFRGGYAVVEKDSKTYFSLKRLPILRKSKELPLVFLRKLPFITRSLDIKVVFGSEVYIKFLVEENKLKAIEKTNDSIEQDANHIFDNKQCKFLRTNQEFCKEEMLVESPSGYCWKHILQDPKLAELGIEISQFIPKAEKNSKRETVVRKLTKLKAEGKF
jgi:hypothetical protein